jgi:hypothetical protein
MPIPTFWEMAKTLIIQKDRLSQIFEFFEGQKVNSNSSRPTAVCYSLPFPWASSDHPLWKSRGIDRILIVKLIWLWFFNHGQLHGCATSWGYGQAE